MRNSTAKAAAFLDVCDDHHGRNVLLPRSLDDRGIGYVYQAAIRLHLIAKNAVIGKMGQRLLQNTCVNARQRISVYINISKLWWHNRHDNHLTDFYFRRIADARIGGMYACNCCAMMASDGIESVPCDNFVHHFISQNNQCLPNRQPIRIFYIVIVYYALHRYIEFSGDRINAISQLYSINNQNNHTLSNLVYEKVCGWVTLVLILP